MINVPNARTAGNGYGNIIVMTGDNGSNPATHLGRQMKRDRLAHGWSLRELAARTGINFAHLGRIENGTRPPTEKIALACDAVFPERKGWYLDYYEESKSWMPPGLRSWAEHEDKAVRLSVWAPGIVHGLLQTPDYARAMLAVHPGVTDEVLAARLASRMERQHRALYRDDPPRVSAVLDHVALWRCVGSPETMAGQMCHLAEIAAMPNVTVQVMPAVAHPGTASELIIADDNAAYAEHLAAGGVFTETQTSTRLAVTFDTLRAECYRASDSAAIIKKAEQTWTGERPPTAGPTDRA